MGHAIDLTAAKSCAPVCSALLKLTARGALLSPGVQRSRSLPCCPRANRGKIKMSYSSLPQFGCVSNRSEGNPAWAWRRRSMDRPKLAICAVEKAPPSFSPAFCRTLIGLPPIISLRERAGEGAGEQVSPTSQYVIVSRSVARRTDGVPARAPPAPGLPLYAIPFSSRGSSGLE